MKKILLVVLVLAVALMTATSAFAVIANSKHDLSVTSTNGGIKASTTSLSSCQFCHTPHLRLNAATVNAPLWNRSMATYNYTLYTGVSGTMNQPGAASLTCLSCHDGVQSVASVLVGGPAAGFTAAIGTQMLAGGQLGLPANNNNNLTTNLSNEHPIGVTYAAGGNAGLATVGGTSDGSSVEVVVGRGWRIYGATIATSKVECGSCHDPHTTVAAQHPFLKGAAATICSDCHSAK